MRIIVNESQYNKILKEEKILYNCNKEWANYTTDIIIPKIISLHHSFKSVAT